MYIQSSLYRKHQPTPSSMWALLVFKLMSVAYIYVCVHWTWTTTIFFQQMILYLIFAINVGDN